MKAVKLQDAVKLAKLAGKHANVESARRFTTHVVPEVTRPARIVWNQAIGFLFICLAVPAVFKGIQMYRSLNTDPKGGFGVVVSAIFAVVMVSFGISSFMKARRIASRTNRP
jgi:hypothetical protein